MNLWNLASGVKRMERSMSTQIQPTPIVTGEAAEKIKEQLKIRPSEQTKKGMEILEKMFEDKHC